MTIIRFLLMVLLTISATFSAEGVSAVKGDQFADITRGALRVVRANGEVVECPLKQSAYAVDIAGPVAQVTLVQTFINPFPEPIEAVYVFPLSFRRWETSGSRRWWWDEKFGKCCGLGVAFPAPSSRRGWFVASGHLSRRLHRSDKMRARCWWSG